MLNIGRFLAGCAIATVATFTLPAVAQQSPEGYWVDKDNSFVVQVYRCGNELCGQLVGLIAEDLNRRDKRGRPWCGLPVLGELKASTRETGKWEGGWIFNPEDNRTYRSEARLIGSDRLRLRGSVLGGLFGENLDLVREQGVTMRCREQMAAQ
jgi:uncharacterized protein (DUF2147 family)